MIKFKKINQKNYKDNFLYVDQMVLFSQKWFLLIFFMKFESVT